MSRQAPTGFRWASQRGHRNDPQFGFTDDATVEEALAKMRHRLRHGIPVNLSKGEAIAVLRALEGDEE